MYDHKLFIEDFGAENIIVRNRTISKKWLKNSCIKDIILIFLTNILDIIHRYSK